MPQGEVFGCLRSRYGEVLGASGEVLGASGEVLEWERSESNQGPARDGRLRDNRWTTRNPEFVRLSDLYIFSRQEKVHNSSTQSQNGMERSGARRERRSGASALGGRRRMPPRRGAKTSAEEARWVPRRRRSCSAVGPATELEPQGAVQPHSWSRDLEQRGSAETVQVVGAGKDMERRRRGARKTRPARRVPNHGSTTKSQPRAWTAVVEASGSTNMGIRR